MAAKPPLGSGERFKALVNSGKSKALAAWIGRKKHGKKKMSQLSAAGKAREAGPGPMPMMKKGK